MSGYAGLTPDQMEQGAKILQSLMDAARKQQELRFAPWLLAFSGMTAGAAIFGLGIAFARFVLPASGSGG